MEKFKTKTAVFSQKSRGVGQMLHDYKGMCEMAAAFLPVIVLLDVLAFQLISTIEFATLRAKTVRFIQDCHPFNIWLYITIVLAVGYLLTCKYYSSLLAESKTTDDRRVTDYAEIVNTVQFLLFLATITTTFIWMVVPSSNCWPVLFLMMCLISVLFCIAVWLSSNIACIVGLVMNWQPFCQTCAGYAAFKKEQKEKRNEKDK